MEVNSGITFTGFRDWIRRFDLGARDKYQHGEGYIYIATKLHK